MDKTDIMCDLETLGTTADSVLLSAGFVIARNNEIVATHEVFFDLRDQFVGGSYVRRVDPSTLLWWFDQEDTARQAQINVDRIPFRDAIYNIGAWMHANGVNDKTLFWGNGSDFDVAMLCHAFKQVGVPTPWQFWNHRCFRTVKSMYKNIKPKKVNDHTALNDAINQMDRLFAIRAHIAEAKDSCNV